MTGKKIFILLITGALSSGMALGMARRTTASLAKQPTKYGMSSIFAPVGNAYQSTAGAAYQPSMQSNPYAKSMQSQQQVMHDWHPATQKMLPRFQQKESNQKQDNSRFSWKHNWGFPHFQRIMGYLSGIAISIVIFKTNLVPYILTYYVTTPGTLSFKVQSYLDNQDWKALDSLINQSLDVLEGSEQDIQTSDLILDSTIQKAIEMSKSVLPFLKAFYTMVVIETLVIHHADERAIAYMLYSHDKRQIKQMKADGDIVDYKGGEDYSRMSGVIAAVKFQDQEMFSFYLQNISRIASELPLHAIRVMLYDSTDQGAIGVLDVNKTLTLEQEKMLNVLFNHAPVLLDIHTGLEVSARTATEALEMAEAEQMAKKVAHDLQLLLDKSDNDRLKEKAHKYFRNYVD